MANDPTIIPAPNIDTLLSKAGLGTAANAVDQVLKQSSIGDTRTAIGDNFFGINHRQTPSAIQINKDMFGLTFFTRPRLNLSSVNLRAVRLMTPLLSTDPNSLPRIIRCLLDPTLNGKAAGGTSLTTVNGVQTRGENIVSPLVDDDQAFIPILTNTLLSISGWPDVMAQTYTATEGIYKESFSHVDNVTENYSVYPLQANFRNIPGDPITALFFYWLHYSSLVHRGLLVPYPEFIVDNEIDYQTRIYRLVLDQTKTKVQGIAACGAAFPLSSPMGAKFNYEHDRPFNSSNDQISIPFQAIGVMYQDDILIAEFNRTVAMFNKAMDETNFTPSTSNKTTVYTNPKYTQIPIAALGIFNNKGYPRINPYTYNLEWWIDNSVYNTLMPKSAKTSAAVAGFSNPLGSLNAIQNAVNGLPGSTASIANGVITGSNNVNNNYTNSTVGAGASQFTKQPSPFASPANAVPSVTQSINDDVANIGLSSNS